MSGGGGQVLSADAIAALVDAAREGRLPEEAPTQRRRRMRAVDFTRPTKFTSEQERRLKRSLEAFCRTASTRLSAELRVALELEVINSTQLTWANARAGRVELDHRADRDAADRDAAHARLRAGLVLGSIELLLGGRHRRGARAQADRHRLRAGPLLRRCAQLSIIWTDMAELDLTVVQLEQHLETAQMIPVSEPTLTFTIEARLGGTSTTVALLLPWSAIAPVAERFGARDDAPDRGAEEIDRVRRAVGGVDMTVRAEVASVELPIEQVLALKPGDVLSLAAPADGGVTLFADKVPVHRAKPAAAAAAARCRSSTAWEAAMSADDALIRLGKSSSEAIVGVLEMFAPGKVVAGDVTVSRRQEPDGVDPRPRRGDERLLRRRRHRRQRVRHDARRRAQARRRDDGHGAAGGSDARSCPSSSSPAVSEAMNQMMASAAMAVSSVLGTEVEIGTPRPRCSPTRPRRSTPIRRPRTPCGVVLGVRRAVPARPTRAERLRGARRARWTSWVPRCPAPSRPPPARLRRRAALPGPGTPSLAGIPVRVWAELGQAQVPSAQVVGLPSGAVVELNRSADEPIDLYVNGRRFATGRLMVVDGTDWAVRIETVLAPSNTSTQDQLEVARWPESW